MKRRIALAMAVSMLITSVPVNSLTGLAEEAVIVEDVVVDQVTDEAAYEEVEQAAELTDLQNVDDMQEECE